MCKIWVLQRVYFIVLLPTPVLGVIIYLMYLRCKVNILENIIVNLLFPTIYVKIVVVGRD